MGADEWAGLKDCKRQTQLMVPKITAELPVMETALASRPLSVNSENLPHGEEFTSIEEELVAQALHMHSLFCEDNATVYYCLEEAVQGTQYASTLKSFQQIKNGRGALSLIIQQFARANKWQTELSMRDKFMYKKVWNGQMLYPLEMFIAQHRGAFIAMKEAAEH
eukprot:1943140-Ditylum_brightwellii.AAC.1